MHKDKALYQSLIELTTSFSQAVNRLKFSFPVAFVYNPLDYASSGYFDYIKKYGNTKKKIVFLGMNPGPWGMAQTGVPFGEIEAVKNWLKIDLNIQKPEDEHPKRPIAGFDCPRAEVSGHRLWGYFKEKYGAPERFFKDHFVLNYCPLVFMEESARNRTPDKLKRDERQDLFRLCDAHLREVTALLEPHTVIGIGAFAEQRLVEALGSDGPRIGRVLHPSPANPNANRGWGTIFEDQLKSILSSESD